MYAKLVVRICAKESIRMGQVRIYIIRFRMGGLAIYSVGIYVLITLMKRKKIHWIEKANQANKIKRRH